MEKKTESLIIIMLCCLALGFIGGVIFSIYYDGDKQEPYMPQKYIFSYDSFENICHVSLDNPSDAEFYLEKCKELSKWNNIIWIDGYHEEINMSECPSEYTGGVCWKNHKGEWYNYTGLNTTSEVQKR